MTQPEALRLAAELEACPSINYKAHAAELRRLYEENQRLRGIVPEVLERLNDELCEENERLEQQRDALLEALKQIEPILARMYGPQAAELPPMQIVRAAIAKAEENT